MNLGQAVAVCLYEIIRSPAAARQNTASRQAAHAEDLERLTQLLEDVLARSGYVQAGTKSSTQLKIRRLIRRLDIIYDVLRFRSDCLEGDIGHAALILDNEQEIVAGVIKVLIALIQGQNDVIVGFANIHRRIGSALIRPNDLML